MFHLSKCPDYILIVTLEYTLKKKVIKCIFKNEKVFQTTFYPLVGCHYTNQSPERTVTINFSFLKDSNSFSMFIWFYKAPDAQQIPLVL